MGFRQMVFANKTGVAIVPNTIIGGVSSTINTAQLLADKFAYYPSGASLSASEIKNFTIIGEDIQCLINVDYEIKAVAFQDNAQIKSFVDKDNRVKKVNNSAFRRTSNLTLVRFDGCLHIGGNQILNDGASKTFHFKNATTLDNFAFYRENNIRNYVLYIPSAVNLGDTSGFETVLSRGGTFGDVLIYLNPFLQTSNGGAEEGDVATARSQGITIRYVQNFTAPNPLTNLSVGNVYGKSIQLIDSGNNTNAIDYYENIKVNGIAYPNVKANGYIKGLSLNTSYTIEATAVDIYYNKSYSATITQSTNQSYVVPSENIVSYWKMESNFLDSKGTNNGTGTAVAFADGLVGKEAVFNGTSSYITIADADNLSFANGSNDLPFSFIFYLRPNDLVTTVRLFSKRNDPAAEYDITYSGDKVSLTLFGSSNTSTTISAASAVLNSTIGQGFFVTITYDGSGIETGIKIYKSTALSISTTSKGGIYTKMNNTTSPLYIGALKRYNVQWHNGNLDEIAIINKELKDFEVDDIISKLETGQSLI